MRSQGDRQDQVEATGRPLALTRLANDALASSANALRQVERRRVAPTIHEIDEAIQRI